MGIKLIDERQTGRSRETDWEIKRDRLGDQERQTGRSRGRICRN